MKLIKKIEIKHFRSVFEQDIKELKHFNIFGGPNDSGKSNALKALNLFFNNQTSFLEDFDFQSDFSIFSKIKARESKRGRQYISIKIHFDSSEIKGKHGLRKLAEQHPDEGLWVERRWWAYSDDGSYSQSIPNYIVNADQGIKRSYSVFLQSIKYVYIPAFKSEDVFSYILRLSAKNNGLFLSNTAKKELDSNIAKTTLEFSKDFSDLTNIETNVTLPISLESFWSSLEVNSLFNTQNFKTNTGSHLIKFASRGEGVKSLFVPVVLGWLSRKSKEDYWIWGIDEPENALEALKADNLFSKFFEYAECAQIFVSTHSPSFIFPQINKGDRKEVDDVCRVYITEQKKPGNTTFESLNGKKETLESLFGFDYGSFLRVQEEYSKNIKEQDVLKKELSSLKKPILFVEGETDKIILEVAWGTLFPRVTSPFEILSKGCAQQVAFALENSDLFSKEIIIGLFDFDAEGYQRWNGLSSRSYVDTKSTPENCLIKKRGKKKHYAILLPAPVDGDARAQVIDPQTNEHYGDESRYCVEMMFYGIPRLIDSFEIKTTPGGGNKIKLRGDKMLFAKNTKKLGKPEFSRFIPLFLTLAHLCEIDLEMGAGA